MSLVLLASVLLVLFHGGEIAACPNGYNAITTGCYKIYNGTGFTWFRARDYCANESSVLSKNETVANASTHLLALEYLIEKNALFYWMNAYGLHGEFWIDGNVSASTWEWSNNSITWYFEPEKRAITGNGTNYKLVYNSNQSSYQIADDVYSKALFFICEYQVPCNDSSICQHDGSCYVNLGEPLCVCQPGYTGDNCETELDECLSAPCQHGGACINAINNYTCDCSNISYTGRNCDIPKVDPTQSTRTSAFWAVLGIVTGLVVILTLSDLPWEDIMVSIGCTGHPLNCCGKKPVDDGLNGNDARSFNSPTNNYDYGGKQTSMTDRSPAFKGGNYHIMDTVWDSEHMHGQTPKNPHYNGYISPDHNKTSDNTHGQSIAATTTTKQNQSNEKRVYAVDIDETTKSTSETKDPADTMVTWTQQLQEQLRNKKARETSASSTKQLIHSSYTNND